jgi:hypothetical protein
LFAFLTGLSSALAGLIVAAEGNLQDTSAVIQTIVVILAIGAVVLPAIGGAFSTLADLYQWDKLNEIFETALYNMEEADALSPKDAMEEDMTYRASMRAFSEGTLQVMSDETSQWGQSIRTPKQLEEFIREERDRVDRVTRKFTGQTYDEGQGANRPIPYDKTDDDEDDVL